MRISKYKKEAFLFRKAFGTPSGARTLDTLIKSQSDYPLTVETTRQAASTHWANMSMSVWA